MILRKRLPADSGKCMCMHCGLSFLIGLRGGNISVVIRLISKEHTNMYPPLSTEVSLHKLTFKKFHNNK